MQQQQQRYSMILPQSALPYFKLLSNILYTIQTMSADLSSWALPRLSQLLPLDEESLSQVITYSAGLSKESCAEHLKNLLGDSAAALEFISSFNSQRGSGTPSVQYSRRSSPGVEGSNEPTKRNQDKNRNKRSKAPLHSVGSPRKPENHGNVTGGYLKAGKEEDYIPAVPSRRDNRLEIGEGSSRSATPPDMLSLRNGPAILQKSRSPTPRNQSPVSKNGEKLPPSAAGPLVSDYLVNVKSKAAKTPRQSGGTSDSSKSSVVTGNIADLTAAIAALELSTTSTKDREKCKCNASIHPLFTPAPNCLSCGKIICSLEGLQPCSFCGSPLLSNVEVESIIRELRAERGMEKMRAHNEGLHHGGSPGRQFAANPDKLDAALAYRDKLLSFQAQNSQRTRIVDEAADFETPNMASTQWMGPSQRALALKRQQQILREMEEKARPEWERKKTVVSLNIKDGRVMRTYRSTPSKPVTNEDHITEEDLQATADAEAQGTRSNGSAFSRNPLLSDNGLVRPIWKISIKDREPGSAERRVLNNTWRRVQDDNDDNDKWILDGGLNGYNSGS